MTWGIYRQPGRVVVVGIFVLALALPWAIDLCTHLRTDLRELLPYGFGIHHAGMARSDRQPVGEPALDLGPRDARVGEPHRKNIPNIRSTSEPGRLHRSTGPVVRIRP